MGNNDMHICAGIYLYFLYSRCISVWILFTFQFLVNEDTFLLDYITNVQSRVFKTCFNEDTDSSICLQQVNFSNNQIVAQVKFTFLIF